MTHPHTLRPTSPHPSIMPMTSCDIMWHHRHDVALHPLTLLDPYFVFPMSRILCHLSFLKKLFWHSYTSPHIHLWIFETLKVIISWVWIIHKRLNVNWKKIHSIILSVTCHSLRNFPLFIHIPHIHSWIFETLWVIISSVWVICKRLNVNWKKIHSIILSVTCHSLRNFPLLIHIPPYPFMNFWNPMIDYFLSLSHL